MKPWGAEAAGSTDTFHLEKWKATGSILRTFKLLLSQCGVAISGDFVYSESLGT